MEDDEETGINNNHHQKKENKNNHNKKEKKRKRKRKKRKKKKSNNRNNNGKTSKQVRITLTIPSHLCSRARRIQHMCAYLCVSDWLSSGGPRANPWQTRNQSYGEGSRCGRPKL